MSTFKELLKEPALQIKCSSCNEEFNVHLKNLRKKSNISCPNCEQTMNDDAFKKISESIESMSSALKVLCDTNSDDDFLSSSSNTTGFTISIDWPAKLPYSDGSELF